MLSVFKLAEAMNEAATGRFQDNIAPYEFVGSLEESTSEMNFILLSEQASINSFYVGAEEIMTEAAISNPSALDVLCENVFSNMIGKLKQIIDKIIAMVKGVIAKLKAYFYQLTGKIDKWVAIVEPRVNAAKPGAENAKIHAYKWNAKFVLETMPEAFLKTTQDSDSAVAKNCVAFKDLVGTIKPALDEMKYGKKIGAGKRDTTNAAFSKEMQMGKGDTVDSEKYKDAFNEKEMAQVEKYLKEMEDLITTGLRESYAASLDGINAGSSNEEFWNNITKKATNGEKVDVSVKDLGGVRELMNWIKNSKDTITKTENAYNAHIKYLQKLKSDVDDIEKNDVIKNVDKFPEAYVNQYKSIVSKYCGTMSKVLSSVESTLTTARGKNIGWMKQMNTDHMAAINAYCNYKGEKK